MTLTTEAPPVLRATIPTRPDGTLLDAVLPVYEFQGRTGVRIRATPEQIFRAVREVTPAEMPAARFLGELRYLPARLMGHMPPSDTSEPFLDSLVRIGNVVLAEAPDRELVIGLVGRLHNLVDQQFVSVGDAQTFAAFDEPNYEKWVQSFRIVGGDAATGYVLIAEHRTHALSPLARRKFAAYWVVIGPGSRVLLDMLLRAVKRRAEHSAPQTNGAIPDRSPSDHDRA